MKIIFFGSDDFAAAHLEHLLREKFSVVACVTSPDRPRDRLKVTFSPIKEIAVREGIDCLQPETLKDGEIQQQLKAYQADVFVVIAYGKILPQVILDIPRWCCVNVHGSLLPKYRGAAPIHWAVLNGETETGVSIIRMSAQLDAGDILKTETFPISENETTESVRHRMMNIGPGVLASTLRDLQAHYLEGCALNVCPQDLQKVTYASKLTREMGQIDWAKSADDIHNLIRGLTPWPKAHTVCRGKTLKILVAKKALSPLKESAPGIIIDINADGIVVACGRGAVCLCQVHPESGKPMDGASFARGYHLKVGDALSA